MPASKTPPNQTSQGQASQGQTPQGQASQDQTPKAFDIYKYAVHYLARFASSRARLARYLTGKARRHYLGQMPENWQSQLDHSLDRLEEQGFIDQNDYGRLRAAALRRKGKSARMIIHKLQQEDGFTAAEAAAFLSACDADALSDQLALNANQPDDDDIIDAELTAAKRYIKKRGYDLADGASQLDDKIRVKLYQSLRRQGFSSAIIKQLLSE